MSNHVTFRAPPGGAYEMRLVHGHGLHAHNPAPTSNAMLSQPRVGTESTLTFKCVNNLKYQISCFLFFFLKNPNKHVGLQCIRKHIRKIFTLYCKLKERVPLETPQLHTAMPKIKANTLWSKEWVSYDSLTTSTITGLRSRLAPRVHPWAH